MVSFDFQIFCVSIFPVDLVTYITRFQWDMAKYPIKQSLKNISEIISKVLTKRNNRAFS